MVRVPARVCDGRMAWPHASTYVRSMYDRWRVCGYAFQEAKDRGNDIMSACGCGGCGVVKAREESVHPG
jgi:hypothetical protein